MSLTDKARITIQGQTTDELVASFRASLEARRGPRLKPGIYDLRLARDTAYDRRVAQLILGKVPPVTEVEHAAVAALPLNDDDWGSGRQVDAENAFFALLKQAGWDWEQDDDFRSWSLKATTEEMVQHALSMSRVAVVRWEGTRG